MDLALHDLKQHRGRFIATVVGVGLLFTIVLAMNGLYRGNLQEGLALIKSANPDLWVVERGRGGPFNEQSTLPEHYRTSVQTTPGVAQANAFIYYSVERQIGGQSRHFSIIGYEAPDGLGGPQRMLAGRGISNAHYEMVAHPKLGVRLGDQVALGLHTYTVVGLTKEAISPDGDPIVYLSLPDAQEVLYQRDNQEIRSARDRLLRNLSAQGVSGAQAEHLLDPLRADTHTINAILVRLQPGADRAMVARSIEKWLYLSTFSTDDEVDLMLKGRLASMSKQLMLFRMLLIVISVVILALVVYTFTMEKIRSIAVMKLIGAPNRVIIRLVMEQSLLLTVIAFALGIVLIENTYRFFPRTILLLPSDHMVTFVVAMVGGVLASVLGLWQALTTEPAMALGGG
jgi:putative ABC transport system permease protein